MMKKPRRGWWVAPGGKLTPGESILEGCLREFHEETGLAAHHMRLAAVFTMVIKNDQDIVQEWMLYTFTCSDATGAQLTENEEGTLSWHAVNDAFDLPMAEGDQLIVKHVTNGNDGLLVGTFVYTEDYVLLDSKYDIVAGGV